MVLADWSRLDFVEFIGFLTSVVGLLGGGETPPEPAAEMAALRARELFPAGLGTSRLDSGRFIGVFALSLVLAGRIE